MDLQHWLYRGGRPNRLAKRLDRLTARLVRLGVAPAPLVTLEVRGRRSSKRIGFPLVIVPHDGERYLVAMLGLETNWALNVEAAGGKAVLQARDGGRQDVRLEPVPPTARAPILKAYVEIAQNGRAHIPVAVDAPVDAFAEVAEGFPVYRVRVHAS